MKQYDQWRRPPRHHYRAQGKSRHRYKRIRYSFLRRSGIVTMLILLAVYALLNFIIPDWAEHVSGANTDQDENTPSQIRGTGKSLDVYDGDTIALNGQRIRLKGMDTPEMKQSCRLEGKDYACGQQARRQLIRLIGNDTVTCTTDGYDRYQRILAFCSAGNTDLNRTLVEQGWAVSYGLYQREEANARKNKRGLWAGEFERPAKWRQKHQPRRQGDKGNT